MGRSDGFLVEGEPAVVKSVLYSHQEHHPQHLVVPLELDVFGCLFAYKYGIEPAKDTCNRKWRRTSVGQNLVID